MQVIRSETMGMCFGVRDALTILDGIAEPSQVTIHGDLVHNEVILHQLDARGFRRTREAQREAIPETDTVLVTAHGISDTERSRLLDAGKILVDTTCPLVSRAHRAARALHDQGYHLVVIGKPGHVEVRGLVGDLEHYDIVATPAEARSIESKKIGIVCQTTIPPRKAKAVRDAIEASNPEAEVRFVDTVCRPTKLHQRSLDLMLNQVDVVVVVGGKTSNNTRELAETCRARGLTAFQVQAAEDLQPRWFEGVEIVGLTAGTSTLDETIDEVHEALIAIGVDRARSRSFQDSIVA